MLYAEQISTVRIIKALAYVTAGTLSILVFEELQDAGKVRESKHVFVG